MRHKIIIGLILVMGIAIYPIYMAVSTTDNGQPRLIHVKRDSVAVSNAPLALEAIRPSNGTGIMTVKQFAIFMLRTFWPLVIIGAVGLSITIIDTVKRIRRHHVRHFNSNHRHYSRLHFRLRRRLQRLPARKTRASV